MNRLSREKQIEVVKALVEGNSINATVRMAGVAKNTILKLLVELGEACQSYHDANVRNVTSKRVQCDEIWNFVAKKDRACTMEERSMTGIGSTWTWVAIDADSKLVLSYLVGGRDGEYAYAFMQDVADRLANRVQLTTDAHGVYLQAVRESFGEAIDYAMLIKKYGKGQDGPETRYSPAICTGIEKKPKIGNPNYDEISTSLIERQNLTMRMSMRRFTRLTNGYSKKIENLEAAVALHYMFYNYIRVHQTLGTTPAVSAGLTDKVWSFEDLISMFESFQFERKIAAPKKKKANR
ncbi:MAG: IS1 family transposase [Bacteroidota bacterium]|nr:IS1 family transposase [Bacteroidota bacterium]MDP4234051.1 IS1 family transposase [Bacteroidota bacterium]MDP4242917.1 IS1 family transposase [Bacteroidota bacterium]MDP4289266.1 IS1 family transposase [Bacteroidota bacterium]